MKPPKPLHLHRRQFTDLVRVYLLQRTTWSTPTPLPRRVSHITPKSPGTSLAPNVLPVDLGEAVCIRHIDAADLRQSGYAGPHFENAQPPPRLDKLDLGRQEGTRTHRGSSRRSARSTVREFVDLETAQVFAEGRNRRRLHLMGRQIRGSRMHGPELVAGKGTPVPSTRIWAKIALPGLQAEWRQ